MTLLIIRRAGTLARLGDHVQATAEAKVLGNTPDTSYDAARVFALACAAPPELGSLILYPEFGQKTFDDLAARGHKISRPKAHLWNPSVITIDYQSGIMRAAGDPRAKRHAAAY